jgi:hypothetical protein
MLWTLALVAVSAVYVQIQPKVISPTPRVGDNFGSTAAMNAAGTITVIGNALRDLALGGAYIYTYQNGMWEFNQHLVGTGSIGNATQGRSVDISSDGSTVFVGGMSDNGDTGAFWVFSQQPDGTYVQNGSKITESAPNVGSFFASFIATSNDASTVFTARIDGCIFFARNATGQYVQNGPRLDCTGVQSYQSNQDVLDLNEAGTLAAIGIPYGIPAYVQGAVYVFARNASLQWTKIQTIPSPDQSVGLFGVSVALSGSVMAVSNPNWYSGLATGHSTVFVFIYNSTAYVLQGPIEAYGVYSNGFGSTVAFASNATRIITSDWRANGYTGAGFVYAYTQTWNLSTTMSSYDSVSGDNFGWGLAASADGSRAVFCSYGDDSYKGAVWFFSDVPVNYTQTQPKVRSPTPRALDGFGATVAMNAAGTITVIGSGYKHQDVPGGVYVYVYEDSTWVYTQQLHGSGAVGNASQGVSVDISGTTIFVGGPSDNSSTGAIWIFNGTYVDSKITETNSTIGAKFGSFLAASEDGSTLVVSRIGGCVFFARNTSGAYVQQGPRLSVEGLGGFNGNPQPLDVNENGTLAAIGVIYGTTYPAGVVYVFHHGSQLQVIPTPDITENYFGASVALSGSVLAIGNPALYTGLGGHSTIYIYVFNSSAYAMQGPVVPFDTYTNGFGMAIALASNATRIITTDWKTHNFVGSGYLFTSTAGVWNQTASMVAYDSIANLPKTAAMYENFGYAIAASTDGSRIVIGGYGDDDYAGAVWFFTAGTPTGAPTTVTTAPSETPSAAPSKSPTPFATASATAIPPIGIVMLAFWVIFGVVACLGWFIRPINRYASILHRRIKTLSRLLK